MIRRRKADRSPTPDSGVGDRSAFRRRLNQGSVVSFAAKSERGGYQINADNATIAGVTSQPFEIASGSASHVQNHACAGRQKRVEQRCGDFAHSGEPPEVSFEAIEIFVIFGLHSRAGVLLLWRFANACNAELMGASHAHRPDNWAGPLGKTKAGQRY